MAIFNFFYLLTAAIGRRLHRICNRTVYWKLVDSRSSLCRRPFTFFSPWNTCIGEKNAVNKRIWLALTRIKSIFIFSARFGSRRRCCYSFRPFLFSLYIREYTHAHHIATEPFHFTWFKQNFAQRRHQILEQSEPFIHFLSHLINNKIKRKKNHRIKWNIRFRPVQQ